MAKALEIGGGGGGGGGEGAHIYNHTAIGSVGACKDTDPLHKTFRGTFSQPLPHRVPLPMVVASRARLSYMGRESGQIPTRLWCCILSSSVLNKVGVNMIGTCSEKSGYR